MAPGGHATRTHLIGSCVMREAISKWSPVDPDELASSASSTSSDDDAEEPAADDSDDAHPMSSSCSSNLIVAS